MASAASDLLAPLNGGIIKSKNKPLALACEGCRKKKAKCSGKPAPCAGCLQSKTECVFPTHVKERRTPVRSAKRIDALEDRLTRIEALLQEVVNPTKNMPSAANDFDLEAGEDAGSSSDDEVTAETAPSPELHQNGHRATVRADVPLPQLSEALELADQYFTKLNCFMPLFDEETVVPRIQTDYSTLTTSQPVLWAAVNVILAMSHQISAMWPNSTEEDHEAKALSYVQNATLVVDKLTTSTPDMLGAQALVGIAKVYHATSTPQAATMYLAMATRQIYHLGLNRHQKDDTADTAQLEWRRRLLWIAYTVDKDFSLRLEQPHLLDDRNINHNLPKWDPKDGLSILPSISGTPRLNYFRLHVELAILQSEIYSRLYSVHAPLPEPEPASNVGVCDLVIGLEAWKSQFPFEFRAIDLTSKFPPHSVVAIVELYVRYFNCMAMIHRLSYWKVGHLEAYKNSLESVTIIPCPSQVMCIQAARISLKLFGLLPTGNVPSQWLLVDFFTSAAVLLLAAIIYNSSLSQGWQDLELVEPAIANLVILARHGDTERLQHIHSNCIELEKAARNMLNQQGSSQGKERFLNFLRSTFQDNPFVNLDADIVNLQLQRM